MARTIEFDTEQVLMAAMTAFRHHGFANTSIKALERATGLSSGSLYNSFGDKDAIFARALAHYNEAVVAQRIAANLTGRPAKTGLRDLFLSLLEEPDGGSSGCLLTNSAIEFGTEDSAANSLVSSGFAQQQAAFRTAVAELLPHTSAAPQHALKLLALYQGILVLVRSGHSKIQLRAMIINELETLAGAEND